LMALVMAPRRAHDRLLEVGRPLAELRHADVRSDEGREQTSELLLALGGAETHNRLGGRRGDFRMRFDMLANDIVNAVDVAHVGEKDFHRAKLMELAGKLFQRAAGAKGGARGCGDAGGSPGQLREKGGWGRG